VISEADDVNSPTLRDNGVKNGLVVTTVLFAVVITGVTTYGLRCLVSITRCQLFDMYYDFVFKSSY
jgi:hypothetical protein